MDERATALTEHYQKTYELTYSLWHQRNRIFLILLAVISVATLLTFGAVKTDSLFVYIVAKFFGITDIAGREEIRQSFPFALLQSILLMVVFYLMINLYHRTQYVLRNYKYLGQLEREIRQALQLPADSISFTRESTFYWSDRPWLAGIVKWIYIAMLGLLLICFLGGRLLEDFRTDNLFLGIAELLIAVPTVLFFLAYAMSSVVFDSKEPPVQTPE